MDSRYPVATGENEQDWQRAARVLRPALRQPLDAHSEVYDTAMTNTLIGVGVCNCVAVCRVPAGRNPEVSVD